MGSGGILGSGFLGEPAGFGDLADRGALGQAPDAFQKLGHQLEICFHAFGFGLQHTEIMDGSQGFGVFFSEGFSSGLEGLLK